MAIVKGVSIGLGCGECGRRRGGGWREGDDRRRVARECQRGRKAARGVEGGQRAMACGEGEPERERGG